VHLLARDKSASFGRTCILWSSGFILLSRAYLAGDNDEFSYL